MTNGYTIHRLPDGQRELIAPDGTAVAICPSDWIAGTLAAILTIRELESPIEWHKKTCPRRRMVTI